MDLRAQSQSEATPALGTSSSPADVLSTAASTVHDVLSNAEASAGETAAKVKPVATRLPRSSHDPLYEAVHAATEASGTFANKAGGWSEKKAQLFEAATGYVDAHPLKSVGIAFATGWLIGRITR